jgi:hypothetical protein
MAQSITETANQPILMLDLRARYGALAVAAREVFRG